MAKKIKAVVKLQIEAGKASPAPPIGPALAQHGVNLMGFVKDYNGRTADKMGQIIPVEVTIFQDGSFRLQLKSPPTAFLIKQAAKIKKGSDTGANATVGKLTRDQVEEIAKTKFDDLNARDMEAAMRQIEGTARNMGVIVEG